MPSFRLSIHPRMRATFMPIVALFLSLPAAAQTFVEGDLYLLSAAHPTHGNALLRIDPIDGAQTLVVSKWGMVGQGYIPNWATLAVVTYDPSTGRLVQAASTTTLFFLDPDGSVQEWVEYGGIPGVGTVNPQALAPNGAGRIYIANSRHIGYLNADHVTGGLVTTDGVNPLNLGWVSTLIYEPNTNSLFATKGGTSSIVLKIPLNADGTQVSGAIVQTDYDAGYGTAGEVPYGVSRGPSFDSTGNELPNGTLCYKVDMNSNDPGTLFFLVDPVTMQASPFARTGGGDGGSNAGTYDSIHGWAAELDTGVPNAVRTWAFNPDNAQTPSVLSNGASPGGSSGEAAILIAIGDTVGGNGPPPNVPPRIDVIGDAGPFFLHAKEAVEWTFDVIDVPGHHATVTYVGDPLPGMTLTPEEGVAPFPVTLTWKPAEEDADRTPIEIAIKVEDEFGATDVVRMTIEEINRTPVADAGADLSVAEGDAVTLDASASTDPDGDGITLEWTQVSGLEVTLDTGDPLYPAFTAPEVGSEGAILTFDLVASDGHLLSAPDFVNVTVTNVNRPPIADAGADQIVNALTPVTLDSSASFDPDGDPISPLWLQTAGPAVSLTDADQVLASFTAPAVTGTVELEFTVFVDDGIEYDSASVVIRVESVNHAPVADAGDPQAVKENDLVTLDGTGSSDPDGDVLTYQWTQTAGPAVTLDSIDPVHPTFTAPDVDGSELLEFQLVVADAAIDSAPSLVTIQVSDDVAVPGCDLAEARIVLADGTLSDQNVMWPPNHTMREIAIIGVSDSQGLGVTITIDRVTQDEPLNGDDDGNTDQDALVNVDGVLLLRAERASSGDGRVYLVEFTVTNAGGGQCNGTVEVVVPKGRRSTPVDSGQSHVSLADR